MRNVFKSFIEIVAKVKSWRNDPAQKTKFYLLISAISILFIAFLWLVSIFLLPNSRSKQAEILFVYDNFTIDSVANHLADQGIIKNKATFLLVSKVYGYNSESIKSGRYRIKPGVNNLNLVRKLKSGLQTPAKITLNNVRTLNELAGKLGSYMKADSSDFMQLFQDKTYLDSIGFSYETIMSLFIPDTYEMYWDLSPKRLVERFQDINKKFWNKERLAKADSLHLTTLQVYTLASIVEKETNKIDERPEIAGVYLNRLNQDMPLQADPTVVFANNDFTIKRVTSQHTAMDSPYNTYKYPGLPPGPICMPEKSSIDAVLHATPHEFIYFCARPDLSGYHSFAVTFNAHVQNANAYRDFLDKNGY